MQINDSLNLVLPVVSDENGPTIFGYHTPISREVFESNYRILAAAKSALISRGLSFMMDAGPRIAALSLKDEARKESQERGDFDANGNPSDRSALALLAEIKRLTVILSPTPNGWENLPVDVAIQKGIMDAEDWQETESALVFFTCHYALSRKADRAKVGSATASVLRGLSTSLPPMEYAASLQTSTSAATSAPRVVSSVPC